MQGENVGVFWDFRSSASMLYPVCEWTFQVSTKTGKKRGQMTHIFEYTTFENLIVPFCMNEIIFPQLTLSYELHHEQNSFHYKEH